MLSIGVIELGVVAIVALVILGPERLPKVARQLGRWLSHWRRVLHNIKKDLN